jgi:hypothetical protein
MLGSVETHRYSVAFHLKEPAASFPINLVMGICKAGSGARRAQPIGRDHSSSSPSFRTIDCARSLRALAASPPTTDSCEGRRRHDARLELKGTVI